MLEWFHYYIVKDDFLKINFKEIIATKKQNARDEVAKIKELSLAERKNYFMDYYFLKVVIAVIVIFCIISIIASYIKNDYKTVLNITVIDGRIVNKDETINTLNKIFGADSKSKRIIIDDENYLISENSDSSSAALEKIQTMIFANELDIYIGMKIDVNFCADRGYLKDLSDFLDEKTFEMLKEKDMLYYVEQTRYNDDDEPYLEMIPYGIKITDLEFVKTSGLSIEKPILCATASSHRQDTVKKFIAYILEE